MSVDISIQEINNTYFLLYACMVLWLECISTLEKAISYTCGSTLLAGISTKCTSGRKVYLIVMGLAVRWWFSG